MRPSAASGRGVPRVTDRDHVFRIDHDRLLPAKFLQAGRDRSNGRRGRFRGFRLYGTIDARSNILTTMCVLTRFAAEGAALRVDLWTLCFVLVIPPLGTS